MSRARIFTCLFSAAFKTLFSGKDLFLEELFCQGRTAAGFPIDIIDAPHHVMIEFQNVFVGNGALLSPDMIITSCNCFKYMKKGSILTVRLGAVSKGRGGRVLNVNKLLRHSNYNNIDYDVTLLLLAEEVPFSSTVKPIPIGTAEPEEGSIVLVTGMVDTWISSEMSSSLYLSEVKVIDRKECQALYDAIGVTISNRMFCGYEQSITPCSGFIGGAVTVDDELVGIVSTDSVCDPSFPRVFTNIAHYEINDFIHSV